MAAFTLLVRSARSCLYLASSFSSRVELAFTMAMLSFMRGTWSFMSRMFCARMSSGFSVLEMKNPKNERNARDRRLNIESILFPRLWVGGAGRCRRSRGAAGRDRILGHKIGYGVGYFLFLFLLFQAPGEEALLRSGNRVGVGLHARAVLRGDAVDFGLDLLVFLRLTRLQVVHRLLLHALERVERAVALDGILNDILQRGCGGFQCHENRAALHIFGQTADVLAVQHLGYLHYRKAVRRRVDLGGIVDFRERCGVADSGLERGRWPDARGDVGNRLGGAGSRVPRRGFCGLVRRLVDRDEEVVPLLAHKFGSYWEAYDSWVGGVKEEGVGESGV